MSWGYFLELDLVLSERAWKEIKDAPANNWPAEPGFFGLKEKELERMFLSADVADWKIGRALEALAKGEAVATETTDKGVTRVHVVTLLDKSGETYFARPFASLFLAAKEHAGEGHIALVNDGTYSGEDGVILTLSNGKVKLERIKDCWPHVERLGAAVYGDLEELEELEAPPKPKKAAPSKKTASKKSAPSKKTAPKKTAPSKKSASKKSAPSKKTTKKTAPSKETAKKPAPSKKSAAKKTSR
jgi:hypothetical protein